MAALALAVVCALTFAGAAALAADPAFPALTGRIVDAAGVLDQTARARIAAKLEAHETKTSDQIVVATVAGLDGLSVEDYGNRLFRHWNLGQKDKNNGVLMLVAPKERKARIEVGYGLEGALTDALSKVIVATAMAPRFKQGDFAGGIEAGVDAIASILSGDAEEWQRRGKPRAEEAGSDLYLAHLAFLIIIVVVVLTILSRRMTGANGTARYHRTRGGRWIPLPVPIDTGSWGGGSWGSSGGGGSSGGFDGGFSGGGGSSGGGGASGDW